MQPTKDGVVLGLDLVGGSEITYEANIPDGTSSEDVSTGNDNSDVRELTPEQIKTVQELAK